MRTIFIIDNNLNHLNFLSELLQDEEYQIKTSSDAYAIIEIIQNNNIDLVIGNIFVERLLWEKTNNITRLSMIDGPSIILHIPVIYYSPTNVTNNASSMIKAAELSDSLIHSSAGKSEIISQIDNFLSHFKSMSQQDIEKQKRKSLEIELYQTAHLLNHVLQLSQSNVWELNIQTNKVNDFGYSPAITNPVGYGVNGCIEWFVQRVHPDDRWLILSESSNIIKGECNDIEYRVNINDKMEWISVRNNMLLDTQYNCNKWIGLWTNINNEKHNEILIEQQKQALNQVERLNSFGEITSTISHQLTQPLHVIKSYLDGCIKRLKDNVVNPTELLNAIQIASSHVDLADDIIKKMTGFLSRGKLNFEVSNINTIITESITLLESRIKKFNISINLNLLEDMPFISVDKVQILQVLSNILQNSIEATTEANTQNPTIILTTTMRDDTSIEVNIYNNGPCIPLSVAENLFSPCFTTKKKGTGIGLKVARTIIEAHGGKIGVNTEHPDRAEFYFTLPVTAGIAQ